MKLSQNEAFEIKAAAFKRETGFTAPGKDIAAVANPSEELLRCRAAAWDGWIAANQKLIGALLWAVEDVLPPHDD